MSDAEAQRLLSLEEYAKDQERGWEIQFHPGSFGHHELLDRASWMGNLVEQVLLDHPSCLLDREAYELAYLAAMTLAQLYQHIGRATPDEPPAGS